MLRVGAIGLVMVFLGTVQSAAAACGSGSSTVFYCITAKGKQIQVCDGGKTIDYSFGRPGVTPELAISVPRAKASTSQWQGIGRYMSYSVDIPNGATVYQVFWGTDRLSDDHGIEAGVHVVVKGKQIATVTCVDQDSFVQNMEGIDLRPSEE